MKSRNPLGNKALCDLGLKVPVSWRISASEPMTGWQDSWTFRIVDQDTGAAVPGVPVSVLESGGRAGGYWVSDSDGLVRIPKHDQPRLRLRVGLRNEEMIELDARSLPDDPIPLTAPRDRPIVGSERSRGPAAGGDAPEVPASSAGRAGG